MIFHPKHQNNIKRLSGPVREYMRQRFMLTDKYLGELRCFEYEGFINERQVLHILIFHPALARNQHVSLRTHEDLERHPEVLLYGGYEDDTRGSLYIEDRRSKSYPRTRFS